MHVPRYKNRVKAISERYLQDGLKAITLSDFSDSASDCHVLIVDRLGVLNYFYSKAAVAIVGGSFEKRGCHNVIEPAFFGVPVIVGPYIENFEYEIRRMELIEILYIETTTLSLVEKLSTILKRAPIYPEYVIPYQKMSYDEKFNFDVHECFSEIDSFGYLTNTNWVFELHRIQYIRFILYFFYNQSIFIFYYRKIYSAILNCRV